jgi:hypothetical protein
MGNPVQSSVQSRKLNLHVGEIVEVKSISEILETLDLDGRLDALPFMPEMMKFCGKRFSVFKRADKVNDTVGRTGLRRMSNAVLLDGVRCDGASHGGCQALCQILWKEDWLKKPRPNNRQDFQGISEHRDDVMYAATALEKVKHTTSAADRDVFVCQATEIPAASTFLAWWDVRQYVRDVSSGNIALSDLLRGFGFWIFTLVMLRVGPYRLWLSIFNAVQRRRGKEHFPYIQGRLRKTPSERLNLQPGELVEVKSHKEILETLDVNCKNRGLWFDVEMVKYCGGRFKVLSRVDRILDVTKGRMINLATDCIILENVTVRGDYHRFYPQNEYPLWREIWLKRIQV